MISSNSDGGFFLIKIENKIKISKTFEDVTKSSQTINAIEIQYALVYKRLSKPVIKDSIV